MDVLFYFLSLTSLVAKTDAFMSHRVKEDSSYGSDKGLRSPSTMNIKRTGACKERSKRLACLPDVMFIGASKTGTSSIAHYILQHPMIQNLNPPDGTNEGHYFDVLDNPGTQVRSRSVDPKELVHYVYKKQHGLDPAKFSVKDRPYMMDYTPNYFVMDNVPELINKSYTHSRKLKILLCLRNPTKRAISSWVAKKVKKRSVGRSQKINMNLPSLEVSLRDGMKQGECIAECFQDIAKGKDIKDFQHVKIMKYCNMAKCRRKFDSTRKAGTKSTLAHVVKSMYAYQLRNWYEYFDPSQFHIFSIEQYSKNPVGVLESIFDFLGLPLYDPDGKVGFENRTTLKEILYQIKNVTPFRPKVLSEATPQLIDDLDHFFRPHNALLVELLGWDPGYNITKIRNSNDNSLILSSKT